MDLGCPIVPFFDVKVFILVPMPLTIHEFRMKTMVVMQNTNNDKAVLGNSCHLALSAMQLEYESFVFEVHSGPFVVEPTEWIGWHCTG